MSKSAFELGELLVLSRKIKFPSITDDLPPQMTVLSTGISLSHLHFKEATFVLQMYYAAYDFAFHKKQFSHFSTKNLVV